MDLGLSGEWSDSFLGSFSLSTHVSVQPSESSINAGRQVSIYHAFEGTRGSLKPSTTLVFVHNLVRESMTHFMRKECDLDTAPQMSTQR